MSLGLDNELGGLSSLGAATRLGLLARSNGKTVFPLATRHSPLAPVSAPSWMQPVEPEEEQKSLVRKIIDVPLGGLQYIGEAISKPKSALFNLAAGRPGTALRQLVPFSETVGLTTPEEKLHGRNLLDIYGLTDPKSKGWGPWAAGLALDIVGDPLTYATFGTGAATTAAGKAAAKLGVTKGWTREALLKGFHETESALRAAGRTMPEIEHLAAQGIRIADPATEAAILRAAPHLTSAAKTPLAGLGAFTGPFGFSLGGLLPRQVIGTGARAQQIARGLDIVGAGITRGTQAGRAFQTLFNRNVMGQTGKLTQEAAQRYGSPLLRELESKNRLLIDDLMKELDPIIKANPARELEIHQTIGALVEGVPLQRLDPGLVRLARPTANLIRKNLDDIKTEMVERGLAHEFKSKYGTQYLPREPLAAEGVGLQVGGARPKGAPFPTTSGSNIRRMERFDVPGGAWQINDWYRRYAGLAAAPKGTIATDLLNDMWQNLAASGRLATLTPDLALDVLKKANLWERRLRKADPSYRAGAGAAPKPFWQPDVATLLETRLGQQATALGHQKALVQGIASAAAPMRPGQPGWTSVGDLVKQLQNTYRGGLQTTPTAPGGPLQGLMPDLYNALARAGAPMATFRDPKRLRRALQAYGLPDDAAQQFLQGLERPQLGAAIQPLVNFADQINTAFKALVYPAFPASHIRNLFGATVANLRAGLPALERPVQSQVMTGRGAADLSRILPSLAGLPLPEQAAQLRRLQHGYANLFTPELGMVGDIGGTVAKTLQAGQRFTRELPSAAITGPTPITGDLLNLAKQWAWGTPKALGQTVKDIRAGTPTLEAIGKNLGIRGVMGTPQTTLPLVRAGETLGHNVETAVRGSLWNRLVSEGYAPQVAGEIVNKIHGPGLRGLSQFERDVMRKVIPFYTFSRFNLPLQVQTLLTKPRIFQAQTRPFLQETEEQKGYIPEYLKTAGLSLPLGPESEGKRQYLTGLGLPLEEAFGRFHFQGGRPDIQRTLLDVLGQMTPLIKGPLEQVSGVQFYSGRQLKDLRAQGAVSALGRLFGEENPQLLAQVIANTPASRFVSSLDKLMDPRKSALQRLINLSTGARITNVDVDRQRAIEARQQLLEEMRGLPHLRSAVIPYVPRGTTELTPKETELYRIWHTRQLLQAQAARQAKRDAAAAAWQTMGGL